ncbi:MAG: ABC transporter ATP-binding protein [Chloroflexi bacterium]|nr:ABC transporter ATP-binding protein [Chloroflexota bacterium]
MTTMATRPPASAATTPAHAPLLEASGIDVELGGQPILRDVEVTVRRGEVVGLVGPNGAGKSTLLRVVTGMLRPSAGAVAIGGDALDALARRELAMRVAVVQQLPEAPSTMRVRDLVVLGRHPHLGLLARESRHDFDVADEAMRRAGCDRFADRELGSLSGGERRRAFIARALAQEAPLLLLDEPTSNLDANAQVEILELVAELAATEAGVLLIVHDLTLAAAYCDRIVLLDRGEVVAEGPPSEVVTSEHVRRVYGGGVTVLPHPVSGAPVVIPSRLEA